MVINLKIFKSSVISGKLYSEIDNRNQVMGKGFISRSLLIRRTGHQKKAEKYQKKIR